jgi:hypothetical protein
MVEGLRKASVRGALACALALGTAASSPAAVRVIDGGVIDASPARRLAAASAARAATPLQLVPLPQRINVNGDELFYSGLLSFDWTSDTVSVLVYMEPRPESGSILAGFDERRPERAYSGGPAASFVLPGADRPVTSGSYTFEIGATVDAAEVLLVRRTGPQPTSGAVDVNFFVLEGSGMDQATLQQAVGLFAQVFADARISLGNLTLITVTGAQDLLSVSSDMDRGSSLRQVPAISNLASNPAALNLFFVREITTDDGGMVFGISMGIPAALTIPGTISSGVVVSVSAHQTAGGFDTRNFSQTMAHETGHSLGLRHTTEADASDHDTISDTPECTGAGAAPVRPESCPDGANFMFWSGLDFRVSPGQAYVMLRSPVVR